MKKFVTCILLPHSRPATMKTSVVLFIKMLIAGFIAASAINAGFQYYAEFIKNFPRISYTVITFVYCLAGSIMLITSDDFRITTFAALFWSNVLTWKLFENSFYEVATFMYSNMPISTYDYIRTIVWVIYPGLCFGTIASFLVFMAIKTHQANKKSLETSDHLIAA